MADDQSLPAVIDQTAQFLEQPTDRGLWDTAAFQQTERVATIMVDSQLMPKALTHYKEGQGNNAVEKPLPEKVQFARAVLICNQAFHLDVDPLLFAQCCSIVHGRLMYEGKLVDAMITKRLRYSLDYEFGLWHTDHFEPAEAEEKLWGCGERLAVRVTAKDRDGRQVLGLRGQPLSVEGSAGLWKTTGNNSPWGSPANWRRQLRYRGAREWARAYSPGIMVGIVAPDEADEIEGYAVAAVGGSVPQLLHADFADPKTTQVEEKPARRARKAPPAPEAGSAGVSGPADGSDASQAAAAALGGDDLPEGLKANDEIRQPGPDLSTGGDASLSAASNEVAKSDTGEDDTGHASPGEAYVLAGEGTNADGRRLVYKDGVRFSSVTDPAKYPVFNEHSPEVADAEEQEPEPQDDEGGGETAGFPPEFTAFIEACEAAKSWVEIKAAMAVFWKTDFFKALPAEKQDHIRANTWKTAVAGNLADLPDHAADISAFRLWIEVCEDPDAIDGTLRVLEGQTDFAGKDATFKDAIRKAAQVRTAALRAG
jgi:hypothetical protein